MTLTEQLADRYEAFDMPSLVKQVLNDKKAEKELFEAIFKGPPQLCMRATWVLTHCHAKHTDIVKAHETALIRLLETKNMHTGAIRNILKIYETRPVPEKLSSFMLDTCYGFLRNATQPPAVRAFAITVIFNISKPYPELLQELKHTLLEIQEHEESPAMIARCRNTLKMIGRLKIED